MATGTLAMEQILDDYTIQVQLNDYLDIVCPHYEDDRVAGTAVEKYTLFLVDHEEYVTCKPVSKNQVCWECSNPFNLNGPEKFREKVSEVYSLQSGKEFKEGHSYYYISKPVHHHGESCMKLKVQVVGKTTRCCVREMCCRQPRSCMCPSDRADNRLGTFSSNGSCLELNKQQSTCNDADPHSFWWKLQCKIWMVGLCPPYCHHAQQPATNVHNAGARPVADDPTLALPDVLRSVAHNAASKVASVALFALLPPLLLALAL